MTIWFKCADPVNPLTRIFHITSSYMTKKEAAEHFCSAASWCWGTRTTKR